MADSLFSTLIQLVSQRDIRGIAGALGEPEQSVSRGLQTAIAGTLGQLASKASDPGELRRIVDMVPESTSDLSWSNAVDSVAQPESSILSTGKRLISGLFGGSESSVLNSMTLGSGLRPSSMGTLLSSIVPFVLSFIGKKVRTEGMSMSGLASLLHQDTSAIRGALPAGLGDLIRPQAAAAAATVAAPAVTVYRQKSRNWVLPVVLAAIALGGLWLFSQMHRPGPVHLSQTADRVGTADRVAPPPAPAIPEPPPPQPRVSIASIDLYYATGSQVLTEESHANLERMAGALRSAPAVPVKVSGYTDDVGDATANLALSQRRAEAVTAMLVDRGVARERIISEGFGEEHPIADNATGKGRAANRRVTVSPR